VRVLVTGGAGFVGSRIVELLCDGGADVRVLDMRDTPAIDRRAEFLQGNVADPAVTAMAVEDVDAVCHQAARVGLGIDFGDVGGYVADNDTGTAVLLEALWRKGFKGRLVLASSMVVYGEGMSRCDVHGLVRPGPRAPADLEAGQFEPRCPAAGCGRAVNWALVDEATPSDPRNIYAATKLHQEHLCAVWGRESAATVIALRYHNVYGPGAPRDTPYAGVASIFLSALASGQSPMVFEDGRQTRDFVHVGDVARANLLALTQQEVPAGAYNIASGIPHTVLDMARELGGSDGVSPRLTGQWRLGDVRHIVASPRRAADTLGFHAEIGFAEGMAEFAATASV
jgi:dTDP-L-rhamnose 4-epimerase